MSPWATPYPPSIAPRSSATTAFHWNTQTAHGAPSLEVTSTSPATTFSSTSVYSPLTNSGSSTNSSLNRSPLHGGSKVTLETAAHFATPHLIPTSMQGAFNCTDYFSPYIHSPGSFTSPIAFPQYNPYHSAL